MGVVFWWQHRTDVLIVGSALSSNALTWVCTPTHTHTLSPCFLRLCHSVSLSHTQTHIFLSLSFTLIPWLTLALLFFPPSLHQPLPPSRPDSFIMAGTSSTLALIERWTSLFGLNPSPCHLRREGEERYRTRGERSTEEERRMEGSSVDRAEDKRRIGEEQSGRQDHRGKVEGRVAGARSS